MPFFQPHYLDLSTALWWWLIFFSTELGEKRDQRKKGGGAVKKSDYIHIQIRGLVKFII